MSAPEVSNRAARRQVLHPRGPAELSPARTPLGKMQIRDAAQRVVAAWLKNDPDAATLRLLRRELDRALDREIKRRAARRPGGPSRDRAVGGIK